MTKTVHKTLPGVVGVKWVGGQGIRGVGDGGGQGVRVWWGSGGMGWACMGLFSSALFLSLYSTSYNLLFKVVCYFLSTRKNKKTLKVSTRKSFEPHEKYLGLSGEQMVALNIQFRTYCLTFSVKLQNLILLNSEIGFENTFPYGPNNFPIVSFNM